MMIPASRRFRSERFDGLEVRLEVTGVEVDADVRDGADVVRDRQASAPT